MAEKILFSKYQGAGNDFILIDNRSGFFDPHDVKTIESLCNRRTGIGADGLILLQNKQNFDFEMVYYNADGLPASMCGNGGRCIVAFARDLQIITTKTVFLAVGGVHRAEIRGNQVKLQMADVDRISRNGKDFILDTGSPHYVTVVDNLETIDVYREGKAIRNSSLFSEEGINVNFVQTEGDGFYVRTYERGVEDETLACGTGATAVAIAMVHAQSKQGEIDIPVRVRGGRLRVSFNSTNNRYTDVYLYGPAEFVFEGTIPK